MYIVDRIEHGNGGVCNIKVLAKLPLKKCLKKTPEHYDVKEKVFGFWPVISVDKGGKKDSICLGRR